MAKKKSERTKLTERADRYMSKYIRLFHRRNGYCTCVTCGATGWWEKAGIHAGHFMAKGKGATAVRWVPHNVFPQCYGCNTHKSGNLVEYTRFMDRELGVDFVDDLRARKHLVIKYKEWEIKEIGDLYKEFADELERKL